MPPPVFLPTLCDQNIANFFGGGGTREVDAGSLAHFTLNSHSASLREVEGRSGEERSRLGYFVSVWLLLCMCLVFWELTIPQAKNQVSRARAGVWPATHPHPSPCLLVPKVHLAFFKKIFFY